MEYNEPFTEDIRLDNTAQEKEVDEIIERMNLFVEEKTLLCYMAGMGYVEIDKNFEVNNTTPDNGVFGLCVARRAPSIRSEKTEPIV